MQGFSVILTINADRVIGILGVVVGLLGIVIGAFVSYGFYKKAERIKRPRWDITTNTLVEGSAAKFSGVDVTFRGDPVKNLSVSMIRFLNDGKETISYSDIVQADPLRIAVVDTSQARILEATLLRSTHPANDLVVVIGDERSWPIFFSYLDYGQGGIFQVVHTGTSSADLTVTGSIRGVAGIEYLYEPPKSPIVRRMLSLRRDLYLIRTARYRPRPNVTEKNGD